MRQTIAFLDNSSLAFPPIEQALIDPNGLLAIGGDLSPQRILSAYQAGIFPWYSQSDPIMWWSPDPRAIIEIGQLKVNRTLRKLLNKENYTVSLNLAFDQVIEKCANAPFRKQETWILDEMIAAYKILNRQGHAHSIEVWQEDELIGGLYGIAVNHYFSGESMFYQRPNASKFALVALHQLLQDLGASFIDCQLINPFLADMGCIEISRKTFKERQQSAITKLVPEDFWRARNLS